MLQRKYKLFFLGILILGFLFVPKTQAQMMGNFYNQTTTTPTQQDLQDIQTGKDLYNKLQSDALSCDQLKNDDYEKIGEYIMNQRFGNLDQHVQMNNNMKSMMGEQSEENMHILLGKTATGCNTNSQNKGGVQNMMGWGYPGMMAWGGGFGIASIFIVAFWIVGFIDLVLLGIFLWKKIQKK